MEDNSLEGLLAKRTLLQKPPALGRPPVKLPDAAPGSFDANTTDFLGGLIGDQQPGSTPAFLGAALGSLSPFRGVATIARRAPKRAAIELADLLLGRSKRVAPLAIHKQLPDADASLQAMLMSRTSTSPPAPTVIRVSARDPVFQSMQRQLPMAPGLLKEYTRKQKALGKVPTPTSITINSASLNETGPSTVYNRIRSEQLRTVKPVTKETGSLHNAGLKPLTQQEIKALMEGPVKAFNRGVLSHTEMRRALEANKAKIAAHNKAFSDKDWDVYKQAMERAIIQKGGGR